MVALDFKRHLYCLKAIGSQLVISKIEVKEFKSTPLYLQLRLEVSHPVMAIRSLLHRLEIQSDSHQLCLLPPLVLIHLILALVQVKVKV